MLILLPMWHRVCHAMCRHDMMVLSAGAVPAPAPEAQMSNVEQVQVAITTTAGVPVEDKGTAAGILVDTFGVRLTAVDLEDLGNGLWLTVVPAEVYAEADEEGGLRLTHSGGYIVEIPMP